MHRKIYAADLRFELSKEYMEDPYDVFLELKGVVTPCLHWDSTNRGHPEKTNLQNPMMGKAVCANKNILSLNQLQTETKMQHTTQQNQCPTPFLLCVHVHKCRTNKGQKNKEEQKETPSQTSKTQWQWHGMHGMPSWHQRAFVWTSVTLCQQASRRRAFTC